MNLQEFAALKAGDKIENPMNGSTGEVVSTTEHGIQVCWLPGSTAVRAYSVNTTAWMHWRKADDGAEDLERHEGDLEDRERGG